MGRDSGIMIRADGGCGRRTCVTSSQGGEDVQEKSNYGETDKEQLQKRDDQEQCMSHLLLSSQLSKDMRK